MLNLTVKLKVNNRNNKNRWSMFKVNNKDISDVDLASSILTWNIFQTFFSFYCWFWQKNFQEKTKFKSFFARTPWDFSITGSWFSCTILPCLKKSCKGLIVIYPNAPASIYFFTVNNENTRTMCESCLKLTQKSQNGINFVVLVSLLLTMKRFHILVCCLHCWH